MTVESLLVQSKDQPASLLMQLMLAPFDALTEIDLKNGRISAIRQPPKGKFFAPLPKGPVDDMLQYTAENMVHPDDRAAFIAANDMSTLLQRLDDPREPGVTRARYRYKLLEGGWRWVERIAVGGKRFGLPEGVVYSFVFDLEESAQPAEKTPRSAAGGNALRNELTGLLREDVFFARGKSILQDDPGDWCMVVLDLEQFKLFNEWYGREQGNQLLAQIGARMIRAEMMTGGLAGYFGQDDFCLLTAYDMDAIRQLYAEIHNLIIDHGTSVGFMPAAGVSRAEAGATVEELYDRAALAARHAKEDYHDRIREFEPSMFQKTDQDYRILSDFQRALAENELFLAFQPQCRAEDGRIVGAECLVRWRKADGTMVSPAVFVSVLEEYGFVTDLDRFVWEEACRWQRKWLDGGHALLPLSVNVSRVDIYTIDVPAHFERLLRTYDLPTDAVKIEVAEAAYVDSAQAADVVRRLREKGFTVLMDDFGSGYSSLNVLRSLNVDVIKLDVRFLRMSGDDRKGLQIMESIVNLAKTMGVPIVVEGVETKEEMEFLTGLNCNYVQGRYFYSPMPAEEYEALIADPMRVAGGGFAVRSSEQFRIREFLDRNVFSDAMLNNILGPVAFFRRSGKEAEIVRFNPQFREEVRIPHFREYMKSLRRLMPGGEYEALCALLDRAAAEPLAGARGEICLTRPDGTALRLEAHVYYLEENERGQKFYASVHDVTKLTELGEQMRLLSRLSLDTVMFLFRTDGERYFRVATHGLAKELGMGADELEKELNSGAFAARVAPEEREALRRYVEERGARMEDYSPPFTVKTARGALRLRLRVSSVLDKSGGAEHIVVLHKDAE
ncbi:MAG: EAL domain-containing protein [Ruminococcaceae bacterium]|nr:EAL domain-containing protein [Oscillospiraceae bacterium]